MAPSDEKSPLSFEETEQEKKSRIIQEFINTARGREKLAAAMVQPIRGTNHYRHTGVEHLPPAALHYYDWSVDITATVTGSDSEISLGRPHPETPMPISFGTEFTFTRKANKHLCVLQTATGIEKWIDKADIRAGNIAEAFYDADPSWKPDTD